MQAIGAAHRYGATALRLSQSKVWKAYTADESRRNDRARRRPGAPGLWRSQLWMLTGLHLISIDKKSNRAVERAAIHGPGGAAVANGTLWGSNASKLLRLRLA
jgi:hypothetical protein